MKLNRIAALAALAFALAPVARLDAQTSGGAAHGHGHAGHPAQHAQQSHAGHDGEHGAHRMPCAHAAGGHAVTPAMLVGHHRADLGLTDAQVQRLQALKQDDAAGARAVLTADQRTKLEGMHAAMAATHRGGDHAEHVDCCKDGKCHGEECCDDPTCCTGGQCSTKCRECCQRMGATAKGAQAPPRG